MLRIIIQVIISLYLSIIVLNTIQFARVIHKYEGFCPKMFLLLFVFIWKCKDFFSPIGATEMFIVSFFDWDWVFGSITNDGEHYYVNNREIV